MAISPKGGLQIGLQIHGLPEVQEMLRQIRKHTDGSRTSVSGVELLGAGRAHGGTNRDVMEYLDEGGRDYHSLNTSETADISKAFVREAEIGLSKLTANLNAATRRQAGKSKSGKLLKAGPAKVQRSRQELIRRQVDSLVGRSYKKAMMKYQEIVSDRLSNNKTADGTAKEVTENYARWRQQKFGVPESVVGRASGQLLANVNNPSIIRLRRGKP